MPPRDLPFGADTLNVPCYLSTGPDDPGLAAWKADHPDWFEAGSWTPARSAANERRQPELGAARATVGNGSDHPTLDPATISIADFHTVTAQAKQDPAERLPLDNRDSPAVDHSNKIGPAGNAESTSTRIGPTTIRGVE